MQDREELELWSDDAIANLLSECATSYAVTEKEAATILMPALQRAIDRQEKPVPPEPQKITPKWLMNRGLWDKLCEMKGWSVWIVNEGQIDGNEELTLTQVEMVGLL